MRVLTFQCRDGRREWVAGSWRKNTDWSGVEYAGHERAYTQIQPDIALQEVREDRLDLASSSS